MHAQTLYDGKVISELDNKIAPTDVVGSVRDTTYSQYNS